MRTIRFFHLFALVAILAAPVLAQDDASLPVQTVEDLDASEPEGFVYYSLATNEIVDPDDAWDVAFQATRIRVNGGAQMLDIPFELVEEAPADGYAEDTEEELAIPTGNNQGWFSYDPSTHSVEPILDRTFVFQLASGAYAKVEIIDYYLGGTETPRYYTFRYVYQDDDSRTLQ